MADQTEREALVQVIASSLAMSYGSHINAPKGGRDWKAAEDLLGVLDHLGFHRTPTPHVVTTVAELPIVQMYESGQVAMAVHDANGQPWVLWESERGDVVARSYLTDDEQYACENAESLAWPLTVLTPAPAPVDREALEAAVVSVIGPNPRHRYLPDECEGCAGVRDQARAVLDAIEGVSRG